MKAIIRNIGIAILTVLPLGTLASDEDAVYLQVSQFVGEPDASEITEDIMDASYTYGVDPILAAAVFTAESHFDQSAGSSAGAIGVAQLMPGTAEGLGVNPYDRTDNIYGGVAYLGEMLYRYQDWDDPYRYAVAAYNAGPGAVDAAGGVPAYAETMAYVDTVEANREDILDQAGELLYEPDTPANTAVGQPAPPPEPNGAVPTKTVPAKAQPAYEPPKPTIRIVPPSMRSQEAVPAAQANTTKQAESEQIAIYRRA